jgi:LmbE family N-acetylglucosaminyl deacetylase
MNHKIIRTALALLFVSLLLTAPRAQQPVPAAAKQSAEDRIALYQALLDLTNPWTVMCIAAHPDDEDGTSLIVMRRKYGAHTVSLFSTFGEGGQNAIGPELYEEMGAIRARETMAAAEIQGSEPHFLGLKDFGYSKSADEAFKFWGHDEALRRMVLEIRKLRPDVIITNHSATSNDHGHHQATARLELEAFDAAADPTKFPEQLKDGVTVWQVQRLFVRARGNAAQNTNPQGAAEQIVTIDPNERDPIRNTVFAEEALRALQKHATQGPWPKTFAEFAARFRAFSGQSAAPGQLPLIRYRLTREAKGAQPLPKDSHNFLDGLRLPENVAKLLAPPTIDARPLTAFIDQPDRVLEALLSARKSELFDESKADDADSNRFFSMTLHLDAALAQASGISLTVKPTYEVLIPNTTSTFVMTISNRGYREVNISGATFDPQNFHNDARNVKTPSRLVPNQTINLSLERKTPANSQFTVPHAAHLYDSEPEPILTGVFVDLHGASLLLTALTRIDVAPPVEMSAVTPNPAPAFLQKGNDLSPRIQIPFEITLINHQVVPFNGRLAALDGTFGSPINDIAVRLAAGEKRTVRFIVAGSLTHAKENSITFLVQDGKRSSPQTTVPMFSTEAHVAPNLRVGYIRGFDFSLPNALNALGVESKELTLDEVKTADLSKFTSIIVDNRVYESQPELIAANQKLLDYANTGGTLIVFYHKSDEWNPNEQRKRPQLAPYRLILGNERITDENGPITFLEADHPLLNVPNKLNQDDFKDWIQERGLYYPREWDPQFHTLLQSNDPGEAPLKGGLLVADYGRGHYIYTSMVWYRELRAGVPGAYRMLANMISYGQAEGKR